jgi:hypothetical protein
MSAAKNAVAMLIIASIFLLVAFAWDIVLMFYYQLQYPDYYYYYEIIDYVKPIVGIVASLLLMIGFIMLHGSVGASSQGPSSRLCPNCGRKISADTKFCPFCGGNPQT